MADFNTTLTAINTLKSNTDTAINNKNVNLGSTVISLVTNLWNLANSLSTLASTAPTYNAVDLGLPSGRKWCDRNVGARGVYDYGEYFAWGDVVGNKPNYSDSFNYYDKNTAPNTLPLERDAARLNMGGSWRMPTKTEIDELKANTTTTWTTINGMSGYKIASLKNTNYIFLPAAGYCYSEKGSYFGSYGNYWLSSLGDATYGRGSRLTFSSSSFKTESYPSCYGFTVRAVY